MKTRYSAFVAPFTLALCGAGLAVTPAHAQYFSNHDGYADNGGYHIQVELDPYIWWPGITGTVNVANKPAGGSGAKSFDTGLLSWEDIKNSLHAAFMGDGILRYGPYSAEVDMQYMSVSQSNDLPPGQTGAPNRVKSALELLRVAPGLGYRVYSGDVASIPTSIDARAGFAYYTAWQTYTGEESLAGLSSSNNSTFIQPWLGTRIDFILSPRWRIELTGMVQGFSVDGGSWGWGASGGISYAMTDWATLNIAARALNTERFGLGNAALGTSRSINVTTYGPIMGIGFRFPTPPASPPAPAGMAAAPAPVPAKTYLVFFDWDKYSLTPRATQIIAQAAADSKTQAVTTIAVNGYTDTSGTAVYNQSLSVRRAKAVAAQLVTDGVSASEITARGFGDTKLLVATGPGVREPQNRRVEIVLQ